MVLRREPPIWEERNPCSSVLTPLPSENVRRKTMTFRHISTECRCWSMLLVKISVTKLGNSQLSHSGIHINHANVHIFLGTAMRNIVIINFLFFLIYDTVESKCDPINPCLNGGTCHEFVDHYHCSCPLSFHGQNCEGSFSPTIRT